MYIWLEFERQIFMGFVITRTGTLKILRISRSGEPGYIHEGSNPPHIDYPHDKIRHNILYTEHASNLYVIYGINYDIITINELVEPVAANS